MMLRKLTLSLCMAFAAILGTVAQTTVSLAAGSWATVTIPMDGVYTLKQTGTASVSYTQSATERYSATAVVPTTRGGYLRLATGTLYLRADAATQVTLNTDEVKRLMVRYKVGDVDCDGQVDQADVEELAAIVAGQREPRAAGRAMLNGDDEITVADVAELVEIVSGRRTVPDVDVSRDFLTLTARVYAEQKQSENAAGADYMKTRAVCSLDNEAVEVDMEDYVTTLYVSVSGLGPVESVSVFANDKTSIAGSLTYRASTGRYTFGAGSATTYAKNATSDVVTVRGTATRYRCYLLPVDLEEGVTVTLRMADGTFLTKRFAKALKAGSQTTLTFGPADEAERNLWMATLPGTAYLSMLSTPGAHDACTSSTSSVARCQSEDLAGLLASGVRAFDLRPRYTSTSESDIALDRLTIYHGMVSTGVLFRDAMDILVGFVRDHPTECVSVLMQKEDSRLWGMGSDYSEQWRASMRECFGDASRRPYLVAALRSTLTLDDVRGRVAVVSKNPYGNSSGGYRDVVYGAIVENWPDDGVVTDYSCALTLAGNTADCHASVEDAYNSDTDTKQAQVRTQLELAARNTNKGRYNYTFTSLASDITGSAATMNPATASLIGGLSAGPLGYVFGDFMGSPDYGGAALLQAIVGQNYRYLFKDKTRLAE